MKFVSILPAMVGNYNTGVRPRDPDLPPMMINPFQVTWLAPNAVDQGQGCTLITSDQTIMMFNEPMDQIVRILTGDMH